MIYSRYSILLGQSVPEVNAAALMTLHNFEQLSEAVNEITGTALGQLAMSEPRMLMTIMLEPILYRDNKMRGGPLTATMRDATGSVYPLDSEETAMEIARTMGPSVYSPENAKVRLEIRQLPTVFGNEGMRVTDPHQLGQLFITGEELFSLETNPPA